MDQLERKIVRLVAAAGKLLTSHGLTANATQQFDALLQLASVLEGFAAQLGAAALTPESASRLNLLREDLTFADYPNENTSPFGQTSRPLLADSTSRLIADRLLAATNQLLATAASARANQDSKSIAVLRDATKQRGFFSGDLPQACLLDPQRLSGPLRTALMQSLE